MTFANATSLPVTNRYGYEMKSRVYTLLIGKMACKKQRFTWQDLPITNGLGHLADSS